MKQFYVYLHCKPNGDPFYVGKGHGCRCYRFTNNRNTHYLNIVRKYGQENIEVIVFCQESEMAVFNLESKWIKVLRDAGFVLANATDGGEGPSGFRHGPASIEKMSAAKRGKKLPDETKRKMSAAHLGRQYRFGNKASAETRAKMSAARKGKPRGPASDSARKNLSIAHMGKVPWNKGIHTPSRPHSLETRAKISIAHIGKRLTAEHKAKLAAAKRGRILTPEHRANVSEGLRKFNQAKKIATYAQGESNG